MKHPADFTVPDLEQSEIHLWSFPVSTYEEYSENYRNLLSERESEKAERFYKEQDRIRCRVVYILLRQILSLYTGEAPERISIALTEKGKPYMEGESSPYFNFSHSGDRVLFAFSSRGQVGVDLELKKGFRELEGLIKMCCSLREVHALSQLETEQEKQELFYQYWSSKEAYLKGTGTGITASLKKADCSHGESVNGWTVIPCSRWDGYSASVAIEYKNPKILLITSDIPL